MRVYCQPVAALSEPAEGVQTTVADAPTINCPGAVRLMSGVNPCGVSVLAGVSRNSAFGVLPSAAGPTNSARLMLLRPERSALSEAMSW